MTDHFHSRIDVMSCKLASSCKNKKSQVLLCDLLSDKRIELFNVLDINAPIRNEQRTAKFNHMRIFIGIAHIRDLPFKMYTNVVIPAHTCSTPHVRSLTCVAEARNEPLVEVDRAVLVTVHHQAAVLIFTAIRPFPQ